MNDASPPLRRPGVSGPLAATYRLVLRQIWSRGRLLVVAALGALVLLVGVIAGRNTNRIAELEDGATLVSNLGLGVVVPVIALVFAGAALGDICDDKTLVYLWLTPVAPWVVPFTGFLAALTIVVPAVLIPTALAAALVTTGGGLLNGTILSVVLGSIAYCALFTSFGLVARRTLVWGVLYVLIWEGFVASAGAGVARFAIRAHTRSILADATGVELNLGDLSPTGAIVILAAVTVGALLLGVRRYQTMTVD